MEAQYGSGVSSPKKHPEFAVHMLNETGKQKAKSIAEAFDYTLEVLETFCSAGREFAVAKTKLEEACFFAKKAMAINPDNQQI